MRMSREQALTCCASDDLIGIAMEADAMRRSLHPEGVVSYVVSRVVCATAPVVLEKVAEAVDLGVTGLVVRADASGGLALNEYLQVLEAVRGRFPSLWLHGLSATVIVRCGQALGETLVRLQAAGLDSLAGEDAGVLVQAVPSGLRCSAADWLAVHRTAHHLGLPSTASLRFGAGETVAQRIEHMEALRSLQDETGGFVSFTPFAAASPRELDDPTAVESMKMLSVARLVLDNIPNLEADWAAQGLKVLQMALRFGVNDVGSVMPVESLVQPGGTTEEDLRRVIRGAGFRPVERDIAYRTMFLN